MCLLAKQVFYQFKMSYAKARINYEIHEKQRNNTKKKKICRECFTVSYWYYFVIKNLYPSFSLTNVKIPVATLTTINVAIARQTVSTTSFCQIAQIHNTVQITREKVIITNAVLRTMTGLKTPFFSLLLILLTSLNLVSIMEL